MSKASEGDNGVRVRFSVVGVNPSALRSNNRSLLRVDLKRALISAAKELAMGPVEGSIS